jgi:hypothetical protein
MFLNSTRIPPIRIENQDREIEWEEPFQSRIGSNSFGAKRRSSFTGWIRVMKLFIKSIDNRSEISQRDISPLVWGCLSIRDTKLIINSQNKKYTRVSHRQLNICVHIFALLTNFSLCLQPAISSV